MAWLILLGCFSLFITFLVFVVATVKEYLDAGNYGEFCVTEIIACTAFGLIPFINIGILTSKTVEVFQTYFGTTLSRYLTNLIRNKRIKKKND
jgi:hypothetical protein